MQGYNDYIEELERIKSRAEGHILGYVPDMTSATTEIVNKWLDNVAETKRGQLELNENSLQVVNEFSDGLMKAVSSLKDYQGNITSMLRDLKTAGDHQKEFQKEYNKNKLDISKTQKILANSVLDTFLDNGLHQSFAQPLRDLLYQNISSGLSLNEAREQLLEKADKKMKQYLEQNAQLAVDSYTGAINKQFMEKFKYSHMIVSGSLIKTSSKQCVKAVDGYKGIITIKQWQKDIKPLAEKNGLIKGTTWTNLPLNKLHWGCRHEFTPINLKEGDQVSSSEEIKENKVSKIIKGDGSSIRSPEVKSTTLYSDPFFIGATAELFKVLTSKISIKQRRNKLKEYLNSLDYEKKSLNKKGKGETYFIQNANPEVHELETLVALELLGYKTLLFNDNDKRVFKSKSKSNDVLIIDPKTYYSYAADLKAVQGNGTNIKGHFDSLESKRVDTGVFDIQNQSISKRKLVYLISQNWNSQVKRILLRYRGNWYFIPKTLGMNKERLFEYIK